MLQFGISLLALDRQYKDDAPVIYTGFGQNVYCPIDDAWVDTIAVGVFPISRKNPILLPVLK